MNASETASTSHSHGAHAAHVLPPSVLLGTFAALLVLTAVTVAVARVDLGAANLAVAIGVAAVKASLVALYFMHLRYEHRFHVVVLVGAALFAVLFGSFVLFDASEYRPDVDAHRAAMREKAG
ncbi:MAG TPA: cytochrome C oxidase subunit IV family protein [Anaeromyxobacteraceae bacterium]|nr:cytochrome C oxidase subunit IV family protein [Anaeromyxobacteraceae bacterium]